MKLKKIIKLLGMIILIILTGSIIAFAIFWSKFSAIQTDTEKVEPLAKEGVYNILLLGIDTRDTKNLVDARTDVNILCTIDSNQNRIMVTSFMRDMLLDIPGQGKHKLNSAYTFGGPKTTQKVIENSFGVSIDRYAVVDFKRSAKIIDILGGVDIEVKPVEIDLIKPAISNPDYSKPGVYHLNGKQATSYMRIRKVGNSDYERTQRQRNVLQVLIKKASNMSLTDLSGILDEIPKFTKTNVSATDMLALANMGRKAKGNVEQMRIPVDDAFTDGYHYGAAVLLPDFEVNKKKLAIFLNSDGSGDKKKYVEKK